MAPGANVGEAPRSMQSDSSRLESADTIVGSLAEAPRTRLSPAAVVARTTVLPVVTMRGEELHLVHESRDRYEIGAQLGEGGIGEVFRVEDHDIGRSVAIKRLRADARSVPAVARFIEEIRTVGQLDHPNVVPIHDVGVDASGDYFFVMKQVDGETLETILARLASGDVAYHAKYGFERRVRIFMTLLETVAFAHARGVLHRDIKPANVMIGRHGEVFLMDWGIAKRHGQADATNATDREAEVRPFETSLGSILGTPAYMAPEQARGEPCDERSEVYSLCALLHELLTLRHYLGEPTTLSEVLDGVANKRPSLDDYRATPHQPRVPADLEWIALQGLAKNRAARYPTVGALLERLSRREEGDIRVQCVNTLNRRLTHRWIRFCERRPVVGVIAVLVALALGLAAPLSAALLVFRR